MPDMGYHGYRNDGPIDAASHALDIEGWSASGNLVMGDSNIEVGLQQEFPTAGPYTIQFNVSAVDTPGGFPVYPEALISWTVNGNQVTRRVTICNGSSITGVAKAVRVVIKDASVQGVADFGTVYNVVATVAKGVRAEGTSPPLWINPTNGQSFTLANGANATILLPVDVGADSVLVTVGNSVGNPIPDMGAFVEQNTTGAGTNLQTYDPRIGFTPLAPGTREILIGNQSGNAQKFAVIFGVDG